MLDRITVLSNSSKYSLVIPPDYEEKTSSVEPVDSKPKAAQFFVSSKGCFSAFSVGEKCVGFVPTSGSNP